MGFRSITVRIVSKEGEMWAQRRLYCIFCKLHGVVPVNKTRKRSGFGGGGKNSVKNPVSWPCHSVRISSNCGPNGFPRNDKPIFVDILQVCCVA